MSHGSSPFPTICWRRQLGASPNRRPWSSRRSRSSSPSSPWSRALRRSANGGEHVGPGRGGHRPLRASRSADLIRTATASGSRCSPPVRLRYLSTAGPSIRTIQRSVIREQMTSTLHFPGRPLKASRMTVCTLSLQGSHDGISLRISTLVIGASSGNDISLPPCHEVQGPPRARHAVQQLERVEHLRACVWCQDDRAFGLELEQACVEHASRHHVADRPAHEPDVDWPSSRDAISSLTQRSQASLDGRIRWRHGRGLGPLPGRGESAPASGPSGRARASRMPMATNSPARIACGGGGQPGM